jgi:hypothetical protein
LPHATLERRCRRLALLLAVLFGGASPSFAQLVTDERLWVNLTFQERAGTESPWRWYVEFQGRTRDGLDAVDQVLVRPAIAYDLTSRSSVWFGHGYTPSYLASGGDVSENRIWQQYLWNGPALGGTFQFRTRFEQRWIEDAGPVAWRYRQFVRLTKPVSMRRGLAVVVWDEVFVHMNDTRRTAAGYDQNRFFGGVGFDGPPHARVEIGYVNQAVNVNGGANRMNHVLLAFVNATF